MTLNQTALANIATLAASGTSNTGANALNYTTAFLVHLQVFVTFGTVAATNGLRVRLFRAVDTATSSVFDTVSLIDFTLAGTTSTSVIAPLTVGGGLYKIQVDNLDTTNAVTNVKVLAALISAIS